MKVPPLFLLLLVQVPGSPGATQAAAWGVSLRKQSVLGDGLHALMDAVRCRRHTRSAYELEQGGEVVAGKG
ncbi:MAG: hypothetical protein IPJ25_12690 [Rhodocyclaceae bacterium]|nr:hypothetical protein [Rhodocyclaceae bacterium]